jgi:SnoaL-like domain
MTSTTTNTIAREIYEAFQNVEFDRWDAIMAPDLVLNSPAGYGLSGLDTLKDFAKQFTDLAYRIDLVDEHIALDEAGNGRGFVTFQLHWKHTKDFGGLAPTGREGTSIETAIFTVANSRVTRLDVAANTLDLAIYEWERNWPIPHNILVPPIVIGADRRASG